MAVFDVYGVVRIRVKAKDAKTAEFAASGILASAEFIVGPGIELPEEFVVRKSQPEPLLMVPKPDVPGSDLPFAKITKSGMMKCPACGKTSHPSLRENGYSLEHDLTGDKLTLPKPGEEVEWDAEGGAYREFSPEGDHMVLQCGYCAAEYQLPEGVTINWV